MPAGNRNRRSSEPLTDEAKAVKRYEQTFTPAERRAINEYVRATKKSKAAAATTKRAATRRSTATTARATATAKRAATTKSAATRRTSAATSRAKSTATRAATRRSTAAGSRAKSEYEARTSPAARAKVDEYVRKVNESKLTPAQKAAKNKRASTRRATNSGRRR